MITCDHTLFIPFEKQTADQRLIQCRCIDLMVVVRVNLTRFNAWKTGNKSLLIFIFNVTQHYI